MWSRWFNQSFFPVKQITCGSQSWWWYNFCPTDAMCSQKMWYSAHALFIFTFFFHQLSSWSLLLGIFWFLVTKLGEFYKSSKWWKNHPKLQPCIKMFLICLPISDILKGGGKGGRRSPCRGETTPYFSTIFQNYLDQISQIHTHLLAQVWVVVGGFVWGTSTHWFPSHWGAVPVCRLMCVGYFYLLVPKPYRCRCSASVLLRDQY